MKSLHRVILPFLLVCLSLVVPANVFASDVTNHSSSLFHFQQKLADKGNARAQYKLATMYEAGLGVEQDLELAQQWYMKASTAGIKAATDRNIFLQVKQQGYKKAEHQGWVEGIKSDAKNRDIEAMLLLGQLYRDGIGVKKDLNRLLELLVQVSSSGDVNVDDQIIAVENKIEEQKMTTTQTKPRTVKAQSIQAVSARKTKKQIDLQQVKAQQVAEKKARIRAEKRRKYEAVMEQIRLEQQKIDEMQAQVSGGDVVAVDDEF